MAKEKNDRKFDYDELNDDEKKIADAMGYQQFFSKRDTVQECYDYAAKIDSRAIVALALLQNTLAIHVAQNFIPKPKGKES